MSETARETVERISSAHGIESSTGLARAVAHSFTAALEERDREIERLRGEVNKVNDFRERDLIKQRDTVEHISQLRAQRDTLKELLREAVAFASLVDEMTKPSALGGAGKAYSICVSLGNLARQLLARPEIAAFSRPAPSRVRIGAGI